MGESNADRAIRAIDEGIEEAANITIEQALQHAIDAGRMSIKDAEECLEAYNRAFNGGGDAA